MRHKLFIFVIIISVLGVFFFARYVPLGLKISHISCQLDGQPCPEELLTSLTKIKGSSFFFANLEDQITQLNLNQYQLTAINKTFPATANFKFSKEPQTYTLIYKDKKFLVTKNGLLQNLESETSLPRVEVISTTPPINKNHIDNKLHQQNLILLKALTEQRIKYQSIQVYIQPPQQIKIQLTNDLATLLLTDKIKTQIDKLAIILDQLDLTAIDPQIQLIDLRFKLPVLKDSAE